MTVFFKQIFSSEDKLQNYLRENNFSYRLPKSEKRKNCKVFKGLSKNQNHDCIYKIGECVNINCNANEKCPKRIQVAKCSISGKIDLYESSQHNSQEFFTNIHGLSKIAKSIIDDLLHNYDSRPKRIAVNIIFINI